MGFLLLLVALASAEEPAPTYEYRGVAPEGRYTAAEIGAFLRQKPTAAHEVRLDGWDDWRPANRVPDIVQAWLGDPITPVPGGPVAPAPEPAPLPTGGVDPVHGGPAPRDAPGSDGLEAPAPSAAIEGPAPPAGAALRGLGEVWAGVRMDATGATAPTGSLRRLAAGLDLEAGTFGARAYLATDDSGELLLRDGWVRVQSAGAVRASGRLGVARPAFGLADRLEEGRRFWVAGSSAELERTAGWLPEASLGVGAGVDGERWSVGVEAADAGGEGVAGAVDLDAVEVRARGALRLGATDDAGAWARVGVSAAWRTAALGEAAPRLLGALDVEVGAGPLGVVGEVVVGTEGEAGTPLVGGLALGSAAVPVSTTVVRELRVVVGGGGWDPALSGLPEAEDVPDAWWEGRAGADLRWRAPEVELITGLGYRLTVPQDLAVPLGHALVLEAACRY